MLRKTREEDVVAAPGEGARTPMPDVVATRRESMDHFGMEEMCTGVSGVSLSPWEGLCGVLPGALYGMAYCQDNLVAIAILV
jgi:hypothetical protein